jgi:hypothetical protein
MGRKECARKAGHETECIPHIVQYPRLYDSMDTLRERLIHGWRPPCRRMSSEASVPAIRPILARGSHRRAELFTQIAPLDGAFCVHFMREPKFADDLLRATTA